MKEFIRKMFSNPVDMFFWGPHLIPIAIIWLFVIGGVFEIHFFKSAWCWLPFPIIFLIQLPSELSDMAESRRKDAEIMAEMRERNKQ